MPFSASCRLALIFIPMALAPAAWSSAQTLKRRPPKPVAPASNVAPGNKSVPSAPWRPVLPEGTSIQVQVTRHYPMKAGEAIEGRLMQPIYVGGKLAVPENTLLRGTVVALEPDTRSRRHGRLMGDFTPFHTPEVQFDELMLPGGPLHIAAATAADGAPILHLYAPAAAKKRSFIGREWAQAKTRLHDQVAWYTAPGRGDRALQLLYHQLPYHPEQIPAYTAWSFELTAPAALPGPVEASTPPALPAKPALAGEPEMWMVHALLTRDLTSAHAKRGDSVHALVVEPVYDRTDHLVIPQGATLIGSVTQAKAARSFGRNGKLRFTFEQVQFPEGFRRQVEGSLAGATTERTQNLQMDAEGTVTPRNQSSAIAPILLTMLAGRALDQDGNLTAGTGVASNGFGLVGRVVGLAAGNRDLAAGIGFYAAGLSVYENFLRPGRDVNFPKDTRIEIETSPLRAPVLKPEDQ